MCPTESMRRAILLRQRLGLEISDLQAHPRHSPRKPRIEKMEFTRSVTD